MTKGRPADPTRARRKTGHRPAAGTVKPAALPALVEPQPFQVPAGLTERGREICQRFIRELEPRGLREADLDALAMLAHSADVHQRAREYVEKYGVIVVLNGRPVVNPAVKVARDEAQNYLRLANEFGLTLSSRLRLGLMQLAGESILQSLSRELDAD